MRPNNKGFTLIESLVGIALLGIVTVIGLNIRDFVRKGSANVATMNTVDNRASEIINAILGNISQQIISFPDTDEELENFINEKLSNTQANPLPMAWSLNTDVKREDCTSCPGRYGYVITPVPSYPGLFTVTIKFTHSDWRISEVDDGAKTFKFLVTQ